MARTYIDICCILPRKLQYIAIVTVNNDSRKSSVAYKVSNSYKPCLIYDGATAKPVR